MGREAEKGKMKGFPGGSGGLAASGSHLVFCGSSLQSCVIFFFSAEPNSPNVGKTRPHPWFHRAGEMQRLWERQVEGNGESNERTRGGKEAQGRQMRGRIGKIGEF